MVFSGIGAGHFLLTHLLMDKLKAAPSGGRVVSVSASAYRLGEIVLDDLQFEQRECKPGEAYAQSKLAILLFTRKLSRHLESMFSICSASATCICPI